MNPTPAADAAMATALAAGLGAQLIATHISWVVLAGEFAYKIKQPVRLPFVDYSTLERRRHFCEEEVRLNRRLAPSTYLGVSRITGTRDAPAIDGDGPILDYAVRMRRFGAEALFSRRLEAGTLQPGDVDALAQLLAAFHEHAPVAAPADGFATAPQRFGAAQAALAGAASVLGAPRAAALREWLDRCSGQLGPLWHARLQDGRVRECHGDLHLDNIVSLASGVAAFDCVEFDPALRWIDVIDDLAFAVMDFAARGRRDFALRLLNAWLDRTGDHAGVPCLRFAAAYRALVRAEVERMRGRDEAAHAYADAACEWAGPAAATLTITHGFPGSGKTFQSQRLLEGTGAIRLRSDVERKRLFGLPMLADSRGAGIDLYTPQATARTYGHLYATARALLQAGWPVVVDAAFLRRDERMQARELARELAVPFAILHCDAPPQVLRARLEARTGDASEADAGVLERLRTAAEPLTGDELACVVGQPGP